MTFTLATPDELADLAEIGRAIPNPDLLELLGAAERFCDPFNYKGFSGTLRDLKRTTLAVRERVGGEPEGKIPT